MADKPACISITRSGKRRFWVVLPDLQYGTDPTEHVIAEGVADTEDEARAAAEQAAAAAGIEAPVPGGRYGAEWIRKARLARDAKVQAATFEDSPYLWAFHDGWFDGDRYTHWTKHVITKVTAKSVWILADGRRADKPDPKRDPGWEKYIKVDREPLEIDGVAETSRETFYTEYGRTVHDAAWHERVRRQQEAQAKATEAYRRSFDGKVCVYCEAPAVTHSMKQQPCCQSCYDARIVNGVTSMANW